METIKGIKFASYKDISEHFDIPYKTLLKRKNAGDRGLRLIRPIKGKPILELIGDRYFLSIKEISEYYKLPYTTVSQRYRKGLRNKDLIVKPIPNIISIKDGNETYSLKELAEKYDVNYNTIKSRYNKGGKRNVRELIGGKYLCQEDQNLQS